MFKDHRTHSFGQQPVGTFKTQTLELIKEIKRSLHQNKGILQDIQSLDSKFQYKLYQPIKYEGIGQMFVKPLILRQIDQLMEEKQMLIKKKQALNFVINCENNRKQVQFSQSNNHYSFLRSTWTKLQSKGTDSSDKLDNINKIVMLVKSNIKNLIQNQYNSSMKEQQNCSFQNSYQQNDKNIRIRQQIERLRMRNEDLQAKNIKLLQIIQQKDQNIQQLQSQLQKAQDCVNQMKLSHGVNEKMLPIKRVAQNSKNQISISLQEKPQINQLQFHGINENLKIKILSQNLLQNKIQQTSRTLNEIIQFIRSKAQTGNSHSNNLNYHDLPIPCLNLNHSLSTNEASLSDRFFNPVSKFIPIKTQTSYKNKFMNRTMTLRPTCQQESSGNIQVQSLDISSKKFNRKVQMPLTSDRFRKVNQLKISEQKSSLTNDSEIVDP